jgi:hypothetical protein
MESQMVVDASELDAEGFLTAAVGDGSNVLNDITARIWSLEVRAAARDKAASGTEDGIANYMLGLESRELRRQVENLKRRRAEIMAGGLCQRSDVTEFIQYEVNPT